MASYFGEMARLLGIPVFLFVIILIWGGVGSS